MDLPLSPVFVLMLISGLVAAALAVIAWFHRTAPVVRPFLLLMVAVTVWVFGDLIQLTGPGLPAVILVNDIEYLGIIVVPVAWLFLVMVYTGRGHYLTRRTVPLFFIVPAIVWILLLTNPFHGLYYTGFIPVSFDDTTIWIYEHGPFFWIHVTYCYLIGLTAFALATGRLFSPTELYRRQTIILTLAAAIPVFFNIAYVFRLMPFPEYDLTAVAFLASGLIIAAGILRYQLFSMVPVAYSRVFSMMGDGVIVADRMNRVIDINPAAGQIAGLSLGKIVGQDIGKVVPELAPEQRGGTPAAPFHIEIRRGENDRERYYDVLIMPMDNDIDRSEGYLCLFRNITDRKAAELALGEANRKISLLTSVTRHDIMNKITGVHSYLELIRGLATNPVQIGYLEKQEQSIMAINEQIAFTKEYQQLGSQVPAWQDLRCVIRNMQKHLDPGNITIEDAAGPWEILADPMLDKVFFNLCDNAVKYGGPGLTAIHISTHTDGTVLVVTLEDNGSGIDDADRPNLFRLGYGKHTGLGLFLSREILAITGIAIQETGRSGSGGRFEIRVPAGKYRKSQG